DTILLLNEADIYLEAQLPQNLKHNALILVFLYKLEYYKGVIFLITNRVSKFNLAILNRIYLILRYNNLSKYTRS
ncbi:hypothetical protein BKA61DRAFT_497926, partial [Leptodontidium sp. MPI-SDFR-AT-0119]